MRPECFSKVGLYSHNCDLSPSQTRHPVSVRREIGNPLCDTPDRTRQHLILDKTGKAERTSLPLKPGRELAVASEAGSVGTGTLSSQAKQMGGEGTPVKSKTPLGQTNTIDNKPEFVSMNSHSNSRDPVGEKSTKGLETMGVSNEHSEGKRTDMRKITSHPHAQATCLKQLLLLQLDLIEQQQQQLQTKDKEIDELKSDRETVCMQPLGSVRMFFIQPRCITLIEHDRKDICFVAKAECILIKKTCFLSTKSAY